MIPPDYVTKQTPSVQYFFPLEKMSKFLLLQQSPIQQRHINFPLAGSHQSPNLGRVPQFTGAAPGSLYGAPLDLREPHALPPPQPHQDKDGKEEDRLTADMGGHSVIAAQSGITRQQLINRFV